MNDFTLPLSAFILLSFLMISVYPEEALTYAGENCPLRSLESLELPTNAGKFIYRDSAGTVVSMNGGLTLEPGKGYDAHISPNGDFLAATDSDGTETTQTEVFDNSGNLIYSGAPSEANILDVRWLGNERVLAFFIRRVHRDPLSVVGGSDFDFGYFLIDPFAQEYTYVLPARKPPFYAEPPGGPFIEGLYGFTYDGRYLYNNKPIFDFEANEPITRENFRWGIPATNSHRLISVDYEAYRSDGVYPVYVYDFDEDTLTQVTTFTPEAEIEGNYENSWSPDEALWGYGLWYQREDLTSFRRVELLQLELGEIIRTCLGLYYKIEGSGNLQYTNGGYPPQFAWSRDGRYLALTGVLEGREMDETFGVYIYDTETGNIYEVYRGRADIVGWMANSSE